MIVTYNNILCWKEIHEQLTSSLSEPVEDIEEIKKQLPSNPEKAEAIISLNFNKIGIVPEIVYFTALRELKVQDNQWKEVPAIIFTLTSLKILDLSRNFIKKIENSIENLVHLRELDLSLNMFVELPESMEKLQKLEVLNIDGNPLTKLFNNIGKLKKLKNIEVGSKEITELPDYFFDLQNLERICFNETKIKNIPGIISKLTKLKTLIISLDQNAVVATEICLLPKLKHLFIQGGPFKKTSANQASYYMKKHCWKSLQSLFNFPETLTIVPKLRDTQWMQGIESWAGDLEELETLHPLLSPFNIKSEKVEDLLAGTCFDPQLSTQSGFHALITKYGIQKVSETIHTINQRVNIKSNLIKGATIARGEDLLRITLEEGHRYLGYPILKEVKSDGSITLVWEQKQPKLGKSAHGFFYCAQEWNNRQIRTATSFSNIEKMQNAFQFFRRTVPCNYGADGCFARCAWMGAVLLDGFGIESQFLKIKNNTMDWAYHIVPQVKCLGSDYVFDLLFDKALPFSEWQNQYGTIGFQLKMKKNPTKNYQALMDLLSSLFLFEMVANNQLDKGKDKKFFYW